MVQLLEDESPASGRSPENKLKPIQQTTGTNESSLQPNSAPAVQPATKVAEPTPNISVPNKPVLSSFNRQTEQAAKPKVMSGFGPSLRKQRPEQKTETNTDTEQPKSEHLPLDMDKFRVEWYNFIQSLPRESQAMAQRMRDMRPTLMGDDTIGIEVNNTQVEQYMNSILPTLSAHVRKVLHNDFITFKIIVTEVQQATLKYSKPELYNKMSATNPFLNELKDAFGLVIE